MGSSVFLQKRQAEWTRRWWQVRTDHRTKQRAQRGGRPLPHPTPTQAVKTEPRQAGECSLPVVAATGLYCTKPGPSVMRRREEANLV